MNNYYEVDPWLIPTYPICIPVSGVICAIIEDADEDYLRYLQKNNVKYFFLKNYQVHQYYDLGLTVGNFLDA